jgi:hypothetical protein
LRSGRRNADRLAARRLKGVLNMANGDGKDAGALALEEALRNFYFYGQLVTARDLNDAQRYLLDKIKSICHALHGPGVVHGLDVTSVTADEQGNVSVALTAGVAIDGFGRDIIVPEDVENVAVDVEGKAAADDSRLLISLERDECSTEKVPAYANRSPCEASCCYSRVKEGYRVVGSFLSKDEWREFEGLAEKYHGKTFSPDVVDAPTAADVFKYGERYINEGKVPGNAAKYGRRLTANGGVTIWAGKTGIVKDGWVSGKGLPDEAALARRNVFAGDTLFQMIAEHATDKTNPHRIPLARTKVITGKYQVPDFTPSGSRAFKPGNHILGVGKLMRDGKAVAGVVTSVSVGLAYSLKFNEKLSEFSGRSGEFWDNELDSRRKKETLLRTRYTSELLFGYNLRFPSWQDRTAEGGHPVEAFLAQISPGTFKEFEADFTVAPQVEYENVDGKNVPKLTLKLKENVSAAVVAWSGEVYENYKSSVGTAAFPEKPPLLDCGFTVYWSAAVTDELDMDYKGLTLLLRLPKFEIPSRWSGGVLLDRGLDAGLVARAAADLEGFKKLEEKIAETIGDTDLGKGVLAVLDAAGAVAEKAGDYVRKDPRVAAPEIEREVAELSEAPVDVVEAAVRGNEAILGALAGETEERVAALKAMGVAEEAGPADVAEIEAAGRVRLARFEEILKEKRGG